MLGVRHVLAGFLSLFVGLLLPTTRLLRYDTSYLYCRTATMMGGMRPGIILLREGTDTSQVSAGCNAMAWGGGDCCLSPYLSYCFIFYIFNAPSSYLDTFTTTAATITN
jgi:hypothetical protein